MLNSKELLECSTEGWTKVQKVCCDMTGMLRCWKIGPVALEKWINQWGIWWFWAGIWWDAICPVSLGRFWRKQQETIHKTGLRSFPVHMRAGVKRTCQDHVLYLFKGLCRWFCRFLTINWKWYTLQLTVSFLAAIGFHAYWYDMRIKLGETWNLVNLNYSLIDR